MKHKVRCVGCQYLSGISQMGYRYCGAIKQGDNIIRDVRIVLAHCPINEQISAGAKEGLQTNTQQLQAEIRALVAEFCDLYDGDLSNEAVSLLLTKLRELSAVQ